MLSSRLAGRQDGRPERKREAALEVGAVAGGRRHAATQGSVPKTEVGGGDLRRLHAPEEAFVLPTLAPEPGGGTGFLCVNLTTPSLCSNP